MQLRFTILLGFFQQADAKERRRNAVRKTDINRYAKAEKNTAGNTFAGIMCAAGGVLKRIFLTLFFVCMITGIIVSISVASFIYSMKDESIDYDLNKLKLNYTSFIYVNGEGDDPNNPVEYQALYSGENRVWVDFAEIPEDMKNAIICIEDKRFREHHGVDWIRTAGAVLNLFTGDSNMYGGSTITQQLIKNLTGDSDVSLTRKVTEIFRALNLEKKYSKDVILAAYLNVVNFGSGCNGVQSAANLYFGKDIQDCDLAECAAIAGITQNPYKYNPLLHPEANKTRQQTVLTEMHDQGVITDREYQEAMEESEHMTFVGYTDSSDDNDTTVPIWNWYTDTLFEDVKNDLMELYNISSDQAVDMIYHDGLKIYSAQDTEYQEIAERILSDPTVLDPLNSGAELGYFAMDYSGRVLAVVGNIGEKKGNRVGNNATMAVRQPGSSIKPLVDYTPALEAGLINYSTLLLDEPIEGYFDDGRAGPNNYTPGFEGEVTTRYALIKSLNPPAVRLLQAITPQAAATFLVDRLGFNPIAPSDQVLSMGIGGSMGVTVREMTAGFQVFGNGGRYYEPYTYYYVEDSDGNVILDNRDKIGREAISSENATIMRKLLEEVIGPYPATGLAADVSGWQIYGKTGTTNSMMDLWFVGGSPYAVAGIWTGYPNYDHAMNDSDNKHKILWSQIMTEYLSTKETKSFEDDSNVISATYCEETGLLALPGVCTETRTGWYTRDNMPNYCDGSHVSSSSSAAESASSETSSTSESSTEASSETESSQQTSDAPESELVPPPASSSEPVQSVAPPSSSAASESSLPASSLPSSEEPQPTEGNTLESNGVAA